MMKRKYANDQLQAAYENACDCLYYGYGKNVWNNCGLDEATAAKAWAAAKKALAAGHRY